MYIYIFIYIHTFPQGSQQTWVGRGTCTFCCGKRCAHKIASDVAYPHKVGEQSRCALQFAAESFLTELSVEAATKRAKHGLRFLNYAIWGSANDL